MPELPEVESVRRGLEPYVLGARLDDVTVLRDRAVRRQAGGATEFCGRTRGRRVVGTDRRGKFMWLVLDDGSAITIHLGMSGQLRIEHPGAAPGRHTRAVFELSNGRAVHFNDQRTFGWVWATEMVDGFGRQVPVPAREIAPDLMEQGLDPVKLAHRMRRSHSAIKRVLLNQNVVSGIGNIYADEMLWAARVNGETPASDISVRKLAQLVREGQKVLIAALDAGGTSFDSLYVHVNDESGYFDRSLHAYGRAGQPCDRCGTTMVRKVFMNRSSYLCPRCQR